MKVEIAFSDTAIHNYGYKKNDIYHTVTKAFINNKLICTSATDVLTFKDAGQDDNFSDMWDVLLSLMLSDWFVRCAASCIFFDDDGSEEDVLSQASEIRRILT